MAVTLKDIAKICNVSEGTVDRAINNRFGIQKETKERVLKVAKELNYKPNKIAQSLATGRTKTIGIVCFGLENNYFAVLIDVIEEMAKKEGYFINLILTHGDPQKEKEGIVYLEERHVDGIIIFPVCKDESYIKHLLNLKIPIITIYNRISKDFAYIGVDAQEIMKKAVRHIVDKGYERIIFLNACITEKKKKEMNVYTLQERQNGYLKGMKEQGIEPMVIEGLEEKQFLTAVESCKPHKTAVLCISDMFALEVLDLCKKNHIMVPEQLGIMGYDNMDMLKYISPRICSIEYDVHLLGQKLVETLFEMIQNHKKVADYILRYNFTEGESL